MAYGQRPNLSGELLQKLIRLHEHRKMPSALDRHERLSRCLDPVEVAPSQRCGRREVLGTLEDEHWDLGGPCVLPCSWNRASPIFCRNVAS